MPRIYAADISMTGTVYVEADTMAEASEKVWAIGMVGLELAPGHRVLPDGPIKAGDTSRPKFSKSLTAHCRSVLRSHFKLQDSDMPKPVIIYQSRIYRSDLHANRGYAYVFGDNEHRTGFGGQAKEMRGEPNAIGIATLQEPGIPWSDDNFEHNCAVIDGDITKLWNWGPTVIVFPDDGIGTGLALLAESAPRTFEYLNAKLKSVFGIQNGGVKS